MQGILLTQDSGFLGPIAWVFGQIMNAIFNLLDTIGIPNIGLAIILFTIAVYILMLPMTIRQQKFSKLQRKMQPEIQAITKKYKGKNDQASVMKMRSETQAIYDKYGTSPSGSCLQLLIQMPILFSLYPVIYAIPAYVTKIKDVYIGLVEQLVTVPGVDTILQGFSSASRYAGQFTNEEFLAGNTEYIQNTYIDCLNVASTAEWELLAAELPNLSTEILATQEIISGYNSFLGLNIGNSPSFIITEAWGSGDILMCVAALMIPFLAALTQWINVKLMPQVAPSTDGDQTANTMASSMKTMNTVMPLMSAFFVFTFPSGIGLYWIGGSVVRSVQQVLINKHLDKIDFDALIESNKEKAAEKTRKRNERNSKLVEQQSKIDEIASMKTKKISSKATLNNTDSSTEETTTGTSNTIKNAKPGSIASKANMVKDFNDGSKKQ